MQGGDKSQTRIFLTSLLILELDVLLPAPKLAIVGTGADEGLVAD